MRGVDEDCIFAVDKVGIQPSGGQKEKVIGGQNGGCQYQQHDGSCENTTVLMTICADGISTALAVIFKGQVYQVKWQQDNPTNAS